jgi:hypothetical protein
VVRADRDDVHSCIVNRTGAQGLALAEGVRHWDVDDESLINFSKCTSCQPCWRPRDSATATGRYTLDHSGSDWCLGWWLSPYRSERGWGGWAYSHTPCNSCSSQSHFHWLRLFSITIKSIPRSEN